MVMLRNLQRRMRVFNLEHPTFVNQEGDNGLGKPESLTLLPLEVRDVHEDMLSCVEIKSALGPSKGRPPLRVIG